LFAEREREREREMKMVLKKGSRGMKEGNDFVRIVCDFDSHLLLSLDERVWAFCL